MLRFVSGKAFIIPTVALAAWAMLPAVSHAGCKAGDWILQLDGSGVDNSKFTAGSVDVDGAVGYFLTDNAEVSVHQGMGYAYAPGHGDDTFTGMTQLALDWNIPIGNWVPFVGGNVGIDYGTNGTKTVWEAGPEAGIKYFVNQTTYIYLEAEYDFLFATHRGGSADFLYALGLGVKIN